MDEIRDNHCLNENITVEKLISDIENGDIVLPMNHRKFNWSAEQIEKFFDGLITSYGVMNWFTSFILCNLYADKKSREIHFSKFIKNYPEESPQFDYIKLAESNYYHTLQGVWDGQQRITALYIGLKGSYEGKKLYVNLLDKPNIEDNDELGLSYYFKFLTPDEATKDRNEKTFWFEVGDILKAEFEDAGGIFDYVVDRVELNKSKLPARILSRLQKQIRLEKLINYYLEKK